ncbi:PREDICTED: enoyl-CoA hydratase domain-containing protein 3, mitochondrial [Gekko japonicus]|uniref:Enoyl-CoA hydratase domain-containing protein 3, mitochondrial n=1 Tax=Gekko japonicus TaxID=146911 RepID=A0ABM1L0M7_GEKJA|nr:PREDICTED: enoyl-CoA hydratase domain-containing protein 3, mitochondrial [Gekko japonicus]
MAAVAAVRLGLRRGKLCGRLGALAFSSGQERLGAGARSFPWARASLPPLRAGEGGKARERFAFTRVLARTRTPFVKVPFCRNVVLSNPRRRNALSLAMLKSLRKDLLRDSPDLRVIIISGEGPVFSSGHDLKELSREAGEKYHLEVFETCAELMTLLSKLPVPIIAKVNGLATAAGCQLVASCDIAVASEESTFATPGVNVGLFCSTPAVPVGRSLPRKVALEMLFTGEPITAREALLHGLVSRVVPAEKLEDETLRIARKICESSRSVLALGKAAFYKQMAQDVETAYRTTAKVMVDNLALEDGREGIEAFLCKRKPTWSP